ncbi:hypothetical protein GUJ93_ZPchr0013g37437 [Zizania palustris]|uniref:Secreted protein n=1 Tax=Zizania palustris TaxID=103762 RepID=A0A8J6C2D5_ZIZPA|nr:hypothetical protein GUJ93_ZPchr0013g37437 [Zizania palustris]
MPRHIVVLPCRFPSTLMCAILVVVYERKVKGDEERERKEKHGSMQQSGSFSRLVCASNEEDGHGSYSSTS